MEGCRRAEDLDFHNDLHKGENQPYEFDSDSMMNRTHSTMLEAVQLPAGIAHLDSGLADMDRDAFPHGDLK